MSYAFNIPFSVERGGGPVLPDGAIPVEYIRVNEGWTVYGGIAGKTGQVFECEATPLSRSGNNWIVGYNAGSNECAIYKPNAAYFGGAIRSFPTTLDIRSTFRFELIAGAYRLVVNDSEIANVPTWTPASRGVYIIGGAANLPGRAIFHRYKAWDGGELVRDMIPARIGTEAVLYDFVTNANYHNSYTGTAVTSVELGPDI